MKPIVSVVCFTAVLAASALAMAGQGPETMNLKERFQVEGKKDAVIFPHWKHQAKLACDKCHKDVHGGGPLVVDFVNREGISNDFHKKFCWPCHVELKVPKGKTCTTCHQK